MLSIAREISAHLRCIGLLTKDHSPEGWISQIAADDLNRSITSLELSCDIVFESLGQLIQPCLADTRVADVFAHVVSDWLELGNDIAREVFAPGSHDVKLGVEFLCQWLLFDFASKGGLNRVPPTVPFKWTSLLTLWCIFLYAGSYGAIDRDNDLLRTMTVSKSFGSRRLRSRGRLHSKIRKSRNSSMGLRVPSKVSYTSRIRMRRRSSRQQPQNMPVTCSTMGQWDGDSLRQNNPEVTRLTEMVTLRFAFVYLKLQRLSWQHSTPLTCYKAEVLPRLDYSPNMIGVLRCCEIILFWKADFVSCKHSAVSFPVSLLNVPSSRHSPSALTRCNTLKEDFFTVLRDPMWAFDGLLSLEAAQTINTLSQYSCFAIDVRDQVLVKQALEKSLYVDPTPYFNSTKYKGLGEAKLLKDLPILKYFLHNRVIVHPMASSDTIMNSGSNSLERRSAHCEQVEDVPLSKLLSNRSEREWGVSVHRLPSRPSSYAPPSGVLEGKSASLRTAWQNKSPRRRRVHKRQFNDARQRFVAASSMRDIVGHFVTCTRRTNGFLESRLLSVRVNRSLILRRPGFYTPTPGLSGTPSQAPTDRILDIISDSSDTVINVWKGMMRDEVLPFTEPDISFLASLPACCLLLHLILMGFEDLLECGNPDIWCPWLIVELSDLLTVHPLAPSEPTQHFNNEWGCWTGVPWTASNTMLKVDEFSVAPFLDDSLLITTARVVRKLAQILGRTDTPRHQDFCAIRALSTQLLQVALNNHNFNGIYEGLLMIQNLNEIIC
eukprot:Blabericola_migrator_1__5953@NODE_2_length_32877_cov_165_790003_g1_i0_p4_GENE_NODE_2_length_32877_cov_165_790003_g1_i0NODE_2_length_32877_cov_165_790003_g1_i0_p4_ORF_typecomplete_len774_score74_75_NODE_2_length_32877_cov_165_790003_g1_i043286649